MKAPVFVSSQKSRSNPYLAPVMSGLSQAVTSRNTGGILAESLLAGGTRWESCGEEDINPFFFCFG